MQAFKCNGIWWLPDTPSDKVAGNLQFSDDAGITLSLAGVLGEPVPSLAEKSVPVVLGLVWDCPLGSLVTLQDCHAKGFHLGSPGATREEYFADRLFIGSHLEKEADFSFSHMSVVVSGLSSWAAVLTGLSYDHVRAGEGGRGGFEIRWLPPEPISGSIPGGHLTLGVGGKISMPRRDWSITEEIGINIACEQPQSADQLNERYAYPLQNLMTLATDHPNALVKFSVRRPNSQDDIHVLAARVFRDTKAATDLLPHKMLFSLEDVRDRAMALVDRWIEVSERMSEVCNPYFGIQYKPDSFIDTKFLVVFQSLEVNQRLRQQPEDRAASTSVTFLGELLTQLLKEHGLTVGPLFKDDMPSAVTELMKYRNYVVHRDSDLGKRPDYGQNLYWLTQKLMFLMKACLLTELGISVEDQVKFFRRNQLYVHMLGMLRN